MRTMNLPAARLATALLLALVASPGVAGERTDHRQYRDSKPAECRECHQGSGVPDLHAAAGFAKDHRLAGAKAGANCTDCHQPSACADCHQGGNAEGGVQRGLSRRGEATPPSHAPDFISTHALKSRDDPASCTRCHEPKACNDCHAKWKAKTTLAFGVKPHGPVWVSNGVPEPSWVATHRSEARRNLRSCEACHPRKSDCSNFACHPGLGGR